MLDARTDVVGSLVRPPALLEARERRDDGELPQSDFKRIEGDAVDAALRLQEERGVDFVTDGEMRRLSLKCDFVGSVLGNAVTAQTQQAELGTIAETTERVWG